MRPEVRRTLVSLSVSFALMWATVSMVAGPGSAALVALTGNLAHAGLFVAMFYVAAAGGASVGGRLMDAVGRRRVLINGHVLASLGYIGAGVGVQAASLGLFVVSSIALAAGFGAVNLTRVAAAELFPVAERGRAVAWVQVSATVGAIVGPLLLIGSGPLGAWLGRAPLALVWWLAPPLLVAAAVVVFRMAEPRDLAVDASAEPPRGGAVVAAARGPGDAARRIRPVALVPGVFALAASQAAMAAMMGVAGAAVAHEGHAIEVLGVLMLVHFVGMFGLSRLVGRSADRWGRRKTISSGLLLLALGGVVVAVVDGLWTFAVGLFLAGLGWSFAFIGATVMLTDVTELRTRARTLGRADLMAQLSAAIVATGGGIWYAAHGMRGLGLLAALVVIIPAVLLVLVREARPGIYTRPGSGPESRDRAADPSGGKDGVDAAP